jgi:integrase/recombinase XerC
VGGRCHPFPVSAGGGGLIDGFSEWLGAGGASQGTVSLRAAHLRRFSKRADLATASSDDVVAWLGDPNLKPSTKHSYRASLRMFYRWMRVTGRREDDPTEATRSIPVPRAQPRPAKDADVAAALAGASQEDRLAVLLAALAGLRRAEIAGLHADDIDDTTIRITGKGGVIRTIPIHPVLMRELKPWAARGGYLFRGRDGTSPVTADAMGRRISRLLDSGAHSLRHKFATDAYRGTKDIRAVQELLGHASVATTQVYTAVDGDALSAAVNSIAG